MSPICNNKDNNNNTNTGNDDNNNTDYTNYDMLLLLLFPLLQLPSSESQYRNCLPTQRTLLLMLLPLLLLFALQLPSSGQLLQQGHPPHGVQLSAAGPVPPPHHEYHLGMHGSTVPHTHTACRGTEPSGSSRSGRYRAGPGENGSSSKIVSVCESEKRQPASRPSVFCCRMSAVLEEFVSKGRKSTETSARFRKPYPNGSL